MIWYLDGLKAKRDQIQAIEISVDPDVCESGIWIRYALKGSNYSENEVFESKEALIASL